MAVIDEEIQRFLNKKQSQNNRQQPVIDSLSLYYRNQMSSNYKQEEQNLRKIVKDHLSPIAENTEISLKIYYKNKKLRNLFIQNNLTKPKKGERSHVVYMYTCPEEECKPSKSTYVGYTECSLSDRLRNHAQHGSIALHNSQEHRIKIKTQEILDNTEIIRHFPTKEDLIIAEALSIKESNPTLNAQREGETRVLSIF